MKKFLMGAMAAAAAVAIAAPASASTGIACSNTDITPTASACAGFVLGNAIGGAATDPSNAQLLAQLGYFGSLNGIVPDLSGLGGLTEIDFPMLLSGITIIGVHYGNGAGAPGGQGNLGDGQDTAFYKFDAGAGLDKFTLNYGASSTVRLYQTGTPGAVPEPGTWAMMLLGFGMIGFGLRRRSGSELLQLA